MVWPHVFAAAVLVLVAATSDVPFFALCLMGAAYAAGFRFALARHMKDLRELNVEFNAYVKEREAYEKALEQAAVRTVSEVAKRGG